MTVLGAGNDSESIRYQLNLNSPPRNISLRYQLLLTLRSLQVAILPTDMPMDVDEPLPESEAALLKVLLKMPYHRRAGYALRLVNTHRSDPALLSLIQELLSTSLLPDRVPFPGEKHGNNYITLLFPQSTASKRFCQRDLGITMACALGQHGVPFLLDAIIHPSTAGKSLAITACVSQSSGATDGQLVEVYRKSVPATRESLHTAMVAAGRVEVLQILQLWKEPPPVKVGEPRCVVLERDLKSANPRDRDTIWSRSGYVHCLIPRPRVSYASSTGCRLSNSIVISTTPSMSRKIVRLTL